jgi:hypothetical protein
MSEATIVIRFIAEKGFVPWAIWAEDTRCKAERP